MRAFILRVQPALTIWYHQPLDEVYGSDPHVAVLKRYARLSGLPYRPARRASRCRDPLGAASASPAGPLRRRVPRRPDLGRDSAAQRERRAGGRTAERTTPRRSACRSQLVTVAESENRLVAIDVATGRIVHRWALPADPENVEAYAGEAAVVSTRAGAVTMLDTRTLRVERVIRGFGSPHIAAWRPDGEYVYVTDDASGRLDGIRDRVVRRIFVGCGAHHMAFSPDQKRLWVVAGRASALDRGRRHARRDRPRLIGHVDPHGLAHDAAFTPDGRFVWVTYDDRPYLRVFDAGTRRPVATLSTGAARRRTCETSTGRVAVRLRDKRQRRRAAGLSTGGGGSASERSDRTRLVQPRGRPRPGRDVVADRAGRSPSSAAAAHPRRAGGAQWRETSRSSSVSSRRAERGRADPGRAGLDRARRSLSPCASSPPRSRSCSSSTSSTGPRPERARWSSCVTGARSSRRQGCGRSAISRDSPWSHVAWMQALDLNFPLLSDWNAEAVRGFGIAHEFRGFQDVAERTAFLVDRDGTVRGAWRYETAEVPDFDELLSAAQAL